MRYPLDYIEVSSPFGMRIHPITGEYKLHNGVDLKGGTGTPIYSIADGYVKSEYFNATGGNQVIIEHRNNVRSGYAHLNKTFVNEGDRVSKGQLIGEVGSSGAVTGPHLHFTMRKNDELVDPIKFIARRRLITGILIVALLGGLIYIFRKKIL